MGNCHYWGDEDFDWDALYSAEKIMQKRPFSYLVGLVQLFQLAVGYRLAYYIAMKKYPHIAEEICVHADYPEYIVGGKQIFKKYWETVK